jgi:2-methylisocitrate lyase-like PEP mutase family enzyme
MPTHAQKVLTFRALHARRTAFIIPNPWDVGTARILERLGFEALATTSAGFAFSLGQRDRTVAREQVIAHVAALTSATTVPVSADLENGFGDAPETAAETIRRASAAGAAGGSIEDSTGRSDQPLYEIEHAADRIRAAAEAARSTAAGFVLTARAENFLVGRANIDDTISRLQAYQQAGADVLYAPGLATADDIAAVVGAVDRPVNVLAALPGFPLTLDQLSAIGVTRVSIGGSLARAAFGATLRAAREMRERGTFRYVDEAVSSKELGAMFEMRITRSAAPARRRPATRGRQASATRGSRPTPE